MSGICRVCGRLPRSRFEFIDDVCPLCAQSRARVERYKGQPIGRLAEPVVRDEVDGDLGESVRRAKETSAATQK